MQDSRWGLTRAKGQNPLPCPADHAAQQKIGFLGCEHTLVAHVELFIHQYPQALLGSDQSDWSLLGLSCQGPRWSWGAGKSPVSGHRDGSERLRDLASSSAVSHSNSFKERGGAIQSW